LGRPRPTVDLPSGAPELESAQEHVSARPNTASTRWDGDSPEAIATQPAGLKMGERKTPVESSMSLYGEGVIRLFHIAAWFAPSMRPDRRTARVANSGTCGVRHADESYGPLPTPEDLTVGTQRRSTPQQRDHEEMATTSGHAYDLRPWRCDFSISTGSARRYPTPIRGVAAILLGRMLARPITHVIL